MSKRKRINPFSFLVGLFGLGFAVTACAYGVMAYRAILPVSGIVPQSPAGLMDFLDEHGMLLMATELVLLAIATVLSISLDGYFHPSPKASTTNHNRSTPGAPEHNASGENRRISD